MVYVTTIPINSKVIAPPITNSQIFKIYETDLDGIQNKLGFRKRSFSEWGTQIRQSFHDAGRGITGFQKALSAAFHPQIQSIDSSDFSTAFNTKNYKSFFDNFNKNVLKNKNILNSWCKGMKVTDRTMRAYLENCLKDKADTSFKGYNKFVQSAIAQNNQFSLSAKAARAGVNAISTVGNIAAGIGISLAVSTVISSLANTFQKTEKLRESSRGLTSSFQDLQHRFGKNTSSLSELQARYDKLSNGVNNLGENIGLTNEEYAEYKNVMSQISEIMPEMDMRYDSQGNAVSKLTGKITNLNEEYQKIQRQEITDLFNQTDENGNNLYDVMNRSETEHETNPIVREGKRIYDDYTDMFDSWKEGDIQGAIEKHISNTIFNGSGLSVAGNVLHFLNIIDGAITGSVNEQIENKIKEIQSGKYQGEDLGKEKIKLQELQNQRDEDADLWRTYASGYAKLYDPDNDGFSEFFKLKDPSQNFLASFFQNMTPEFISKNNLTSQEAISQFVSQWIDLLLNQDSEVSKAFHLLLDFDLDDKNLTPQQIKLTVDNLIKNLLKAMNSAGIKVDDSEKGVASFKSSWGIDFVDKSAEDYQNHLKNFYTVLGPFKLPKLGDTKDSGLSEHYNSPTEIETWASANKVTVAELEKLEKQGYNTYSSIDTLTAALKRNREEQEIKPFSPFQEVWDSAGTTGDENTRQKALEDKERLLELAEAGKLTEKAFNESSIADVFKNASISIQEATQKINEMKSSAVQLASMKTGIGAISSILGEKKEKLSSSKTETEGIGSDILAGIPDDVKAQAKEYEHFAEVLGNGKSSMNACEKAASKLAAAYVNSGNFLANLTDENQDYYISVLKDMNIENAAAYVCKTLSANKETQKHKTKALAAATEDMTNHTSDSNRAFIKNAEVSELAKIQLADLVAEEKIFNSSLNTTDKINELNKLALSYFNVADAIQTSSAMGADPRFIDKKALKKQWKHYLKKLKKKRLKLELGKEDDGEGDRTEKEEGRGENGSATQKQQFNWLEQRLSRLQSIIDLTASKLQNLFTFNAKNKNLNHQIKQTTKLIKQYGIAVQRYQKKADNEKKGLPKNVVSQIRSKKITKANIGKLFKNYSQSTYESINAYLDSFNKAQEAKKNKADLKAKKHELIQQKHQNHVDYAEANISLYEQKKENAGAAKRKNDYLNQELKKYEKSYRYQILIARLNKNATEQARLRAEYEAKITTLKKEQLQNTLDENSGKNDLLEAKLSNASTANDKNLILDGRLNIVRADAAAYEKNYKDALSYRSSQGRRASRVLGKDKSKKLKKSHKDKIKRLISKNKPIPDALLNLCSPSTQEQLSKYNAALNWVGDALKNKNLNAEQSAAKEREINIEKHQNLADKHQSVLDRHSAQKNLETIGAGKNTHIQEEIQATNALYEEKIAIARIEGKEEEALQLQAEQTKAIRDLEAERRLNLADDYQSQLDLLSAQKENLNTAKDKNALIDTEKHLTKQLYQEKIEAARIKENMSEQEKLQAELTRQLIVLEKQKLDNIVAYYNNLRKINELQNKNLNNAADELEARGLTVTSKLYSSQIAINNAAKKRYEEELAILIEQHGKIEENTEEWYASLDSIQACRDGIHNMTKENMQLGQSIRNIEWELLDKSYSRLDLLSSEYDLLKTLMSNQEMTDDSGSFTKEGTATLGTYFAQLKLAEEKTRQSKTALDNMRTSIDRGEKGFTDEKAQEEYLEKEKQHIDLVKNEYEIRQNITNQMKQAYQAEMGHLQDIINKRKELLQTEKDAYNYQRTIEEKTKDISSISKQIISLEGDDSEAARTKIQQLKVSLDNANKDLQDTEYDKWLSDQQTMLDDLYNKYQEFIDEKLKDSNALWEEALNLSSHVDFSKAMSEALSQYADEYGYDPTKDFQNITDALGSGGSIVGAIHSAAETIRNYFTKQQSYQDKADEFMANVSSLNSSDINNDYNTLLEAKEQYKNQENLEDGVKNKISSSTISAVKANYETAQNIETNAGHTMNARNAIGEVTLDGQKQKAIEDVNTWWNSLTESGRQIVRNNGGEEILRRANETFSQLQTKPQQATSQAEQANTTARANLDAIIKQTFLQDARLHGGKNIWSTDKLSDGNYAEVQQRIHNKGFSRSDKPYVNAEWIKEACRRLGYTRPECQNAGTLLNYMNSIGYSDGGIPDVLQKVPTINGDDGWITVKKGEGILTPEQTIQFQKLARKLDVLNPAVDILSHLGTLNWNTDPNRMAGNTTIGDLCFQIELPNVVDADSFVKEIQNNPKIEKVIHSMVYDKNSLSKYRW